MKNMNALFNPNVAANERPITSMYISWDWSKPSASNRERLTDEIKAAKRLLKQELNDDEIQKYLEPFWNVMARLKDPLPDLAGLALFRTKSDFWFVQLTQDPGTFTVVADSFHIKPLLATLQDPKRFAVLWFHESGCTLAYGSERQVVCFDTVIANDLEKRSKEFLGEVKKMLTEHVKDPRVELILAGDPDVIRKAKQAKIFGRLADSEVQGFISKLSLGQLEDRIKVIIREQRKKSESKILVGLFEELKWSGHELETDIEKIAKLAVAGQIKTLIVSKDQKLFGQLNRKNGKIAITGVQMNCQDDDLYDDIAECVQHHGGKVMVVSDKLIPGNTGIFAVIKKPDLLIYADKTA